MKTLVILGIVGCIIVYKFDLTEYFIKKISFYKT